MARGSILCILSALFALVALLAQTPVGTQNKQPQNANEKQPAPPPPKPDAKEKDPKGVKRGPKQKYGVQALRRMEDLRGQCSANQGAWSQDYGMCETTRGTFTSGIELASIQIVSAARLLEPSSVESDAFEFQYRCETSTSIVELEASATLQSGESLSMRAVGDCGENRFFWTPDDVGQLNANTPGLEIRMREVSTTGTSTAISPIVYAPRNEMPDPTHTLVVTYPPQENASVRLVSLQGAEANLPFQPAPDRGRASVAAPPGIYRVVVSSPNGDVNGPLIRVLGER